MTTLVAARVSERRQPGRPSKLTDEVRARIVAHLVAGCTLEVAATAAGVTRQTLSNWMRHGAQVDGAVAGGERLAPRDKPFLALVGIGPGGAQPPAHAGPVALGQVVEDVALLVTDTTLNRRALAEHVTHRLPKRLGAVEHAEHPLGRVEPARDQVGQQGRGHGGVLGRALLRARAGSSPRAR